MIGGSVGRRVTPLGSELLVAVFPAWLCDCTVWFLPDTAFPMLPLMPDTCRLDDTLDPARATAMAATLDLGCTFASGDALPPFFHQAYVWDAKPAAALGRDGHPRVGGLIPDMGLPRRMWAGGRLTFHTPLVAGEPAEKRSSCESAKRKQGRTGALGVVTLKHEIRQSGSLRVTEFQDLVYREDADGAAPAPAPPEAACDEESLRIADFSQTLLFRYSALTFNGHRIHYDLPYAQEVEGYAGLVVHGPLLAQLLMLMAQDELGPLGFFSFRATAPLMHFERAALCRKGQNLWVRGPDGRQCMTAEAQPAS